MDGGKTILAAGLVVLIGFGGAMAFRHDAADIVPEATGEREIVRRAAPSFDFGSSQAPPTDRGNATAQLSGRISPFEFGGGPATPQLRTSAEYERDQTPTDAGGSSLPNLPPRFRANSPFATDAPDRSALDADDLVPLHAAPGDDRSGVRATGIAVTRADEPQTTVAAAPDSTSFQKPRRHVVRDGDTLVGLAERYYGDGERYRDLFAINREVLSNPDVLPIGVRLEVPVDLPAMELGTGQSGGQPAARLIPQVQFRGLDGR